MVKTGVDPIETSASHRQATACFQPPNDPTMPQRSRTFQTEFTSTGPSDTTSVVWQDSFAAACFPVPWHIGSAVTGLFSMAGSGENHEEIWRKRSRLDHRQGPPVRSRAARLSTAG